MRDKLYSILGKFGVFFNKRYNHRLRVLAYHKVPDKKAFEKQIIYLKSRYNIISIPQLLNLLGNKQNLPKKSLLITFDDGDVSVLENGLPILKKHNLKSCVFIITELVNTSKDVWIRRVEEGEIAKGKTFFEARQVVNCFKKIPNTERVLNMTEYPSVHKKQLTTKDLKYMEDSGMYIGNHTHTHPMLDRCTSEEIKKELIESKDVFNKLGLPGYHIFAYPNGNTNLQTNAILEESQIKLIFLFDHKINNRKLDPLNISRIRVDSDTKIPEFIAKVSGVHPFLFNLKK